MMTRTPAGVLLSALRKLKKWLFIVRNQLSKEEAFWWEDPEVWKKPAGKFHFPFRFMR